MLEDVRVSFAGARN